MSAEHRTRLPVAALLREIVNGVVERPVRSFLVALGTVIGTASFLATYGITATLGSQITSGFDAFRATEIVATVDEPATTTTPPPSLASLQRLNGVEHAGWRQTHLSQPVQRTAYNEPSDVDIFAVAQGATAAIGPHLVAGTTFEPVHYAADVRAILLSSGVARRVGVRRPGQAVRVDGFTFVVQGIYDDVQRRPNVLLGAMIPLEAAAWLPAPDARDLVVEVAPGASAQLAGQVAVAVRPDAPARVTVAAPPDPEQFRRGVESDLRDIGLLASLLALLIGVVSIASAASAATVQRTGEIGLRRAMGALRRHVFVQLIGESLVLGLLGGVAGAMVGFAAVFSAAIVNGWSPVVDVRLGLAAAGLGVVAGLLAGLLPAVRGMRTSPADALRD